MLGSEEQAFEKRLALRMAVIDTAREMNRRGINVNKSGNVSARTSGGRSFFITPTGEVVWIFWTHTESTPCT